MVPGTWARYMDGMMRRGCKELPGGWGSGRPGWGRQVRWGSRGSGKGTQEVRPSFCRDFEKGNLGWGLARGVWPLW